MPDDDPRKLDYAAPDVEARPANPPDGCRFIVAFWALFIFFGLLAMMFIGFLWGTLNGLKLGP